MSFRRCVLLSLVAVLAMPSSAFAQDDDLLAPLTPQPSKSTSKPKTKVVKKKKPEKVTKKPARTKAPAATTAKGSKTKKPAATADDDLLAPLAPMKTELVVAISGNVRGAKLTLDGREVGTLSAAPMSLEVSPGDHALVVRKPGYADYTRRIDAKPGVSTDVRVALEPTMGIAQAVADIPGTTLVVDGVEVGPVPQRDILLKPGRHEIEFRAPGFKPDVHTINVLAGTGYELAGRMRPLVDSAIAGRDGDAPTRTSLDPTRSAVDDDSTDPLAFPDPEDPSVSEDTSKPWYSRWYVWAGVGAVVAAGTVGAVMATQEPGIKATNPDAVCNPGSCDSVVGGIRAVRRQGAFGLPRLQAVSF
ncbi:PEGA domain-containing protein [Myxococcus sp. K15C18031901]|uniref:PEGA domain-containing protein n=1 Tax=Myxococcus dinghuensis TaxID=2906761 RepID=UPI0020A73F8D|nr:PEGA domain-containing protein [Myxococcus dinghuensis]MCP3104875.1 PEGA domain-containing protein [Myxococcus dinghuensis]